MNKPIIPRLKDVAQEAKVSLSAASRILRGEVDRFGDDTCQRVLEAARRLGWRRNLLVSGMQTGRTKTIGVMIPPFDSFWVHVLSGIHMTLAAEDYLPITVWVGDAQAMPHFESDETEGFSQISRLLDRRVDGLILWPMFAVAYYDHFRELTERKVPVAAIDHKSSEARIADSIETDEEQGTLVMAQHLLHLGHRRIACLSSRETEWQAWSVRRREHFEHAIRSEPDAECRSWKLNEAGTNGLEVARSILQDQSLRPTAVFAVTDHEAQHIYAAAHELGLRIPEDISVAGFADLDFAEFLQPGLTTMRQRPREIGRQAARLVLDRLAGLIEQDDPAVVRVGSDLVVRASTGPPRSGT